MVTITQAAHFRVYTEEQIGNDRVTYI